MTSDEMFNWPDGDVILRTTHGSDSRDFRVHKVFLSFASPVFKDMFGIPQPPSAASSDVDVVNLGDPPKALELILRFIYPSPPPATNDLDTVSEALALADKYDIKSAQSRLRPSLMGFAKTEPLRVYAIACRLGFEDEMKIASSHTTSIHLPGLAQLPEEFKFVPATEYHRLTLLHARYRKEVEAIVASTSWPPRQPRSPGIFTGMLVATMHTTREVILGAVREGTPLDYESFILALKQDRYIDTETTNVGKIFRSALDKANALNLTV